MGGGVSRPSALSPLPSGTNAPSGAGGPATYQTSSRHAFLHVLSAANSLNKTRPRRHTATRNPSPSPIPKRTDPAPHHL